jgi:amidohydrolase
MAIPEARIQHLKTRLQAWRQELHRCPEVGLDLPETMAFLQAELRAMGLQPKPTGRGFVVDLGPAPRVGWRVDMDALPIHEETAAAYASQRAGAMHACGHDAHMAVGLGLAWLFAEMDPQPSVRFIFQPDEEGQFGAEPMIEAGALEDVFALLGVHVGHLHEALQPGQFAVRTGAQMAAGDRFWVTFKGSGTHGAQPHLGRDPLVAAASYVGTLQTLRGREIQPGRLALITVGTLHSGSAPNIVPESASLAGIVRTEHPEDRTRLVRRMEEAARGTALTYGLELEWTHVPTCAPVINHPRWARKAREAITRLLGPGGLLELDSPTPTSDDIAFYLERVPGTYVFLGTNNPEKGITEPNHSPRFDVDETQLWKAVAYGVEMIREGEWPEFYTDYQL